MELLDNTHGERHVLRRFMDEGEGIPVSGDLLLRPVRRHRVTENHVAKPMRRGHHPLESIRRLGRLDDGHRSERLQGLGSLPTEELLPAPVFPERPERRAVLGAERQSIEEPGVQGLHARP